VHRRDDGRQGSAVGDGRREGRSSEGGRHDVDPDVRAQLGGEGEGEPLHRPLGHGDGGMAGEALRHGHRREQDHARPGPGLEGGGGGLDGAEGARGIDPEIGFGIPRRQLRQGPQVDGAHRVDETGEFTGRLLRRPREEVRIGDVAGREDGVSEFGGRRHEASAVVRPMPPVPP